MKTCPAAYRPSRGLGMPIEIVQARDRMHTPSRRSTYSPAIATPDQDDAALHPAEVEQGDAFGAAFTTLAGDHHRLLVAAQRFFESAQLPVNASEVGERSAHVPLIGGLLADRQRLAGVAECHLETTGMQVCGAQELSVQNSPRRLPTRRAVSPMLAHVIQSVHGLRISKKVHVGGKPPGDLELASLPSLADRRRQVGLLGVVPRQGLLVAGERGRLASRWQVAVRAPARCRRSQVLVRRMHAVQISGENPADRGRAAGGSLLGVSLFGRVDTQEVVEAVATGSGLLEHVRPGQRVE